MSETETRSLPLRKSIKTHEGEMKVLTVRLPSGGIVWRLGEPFTTKFESDGQGGSRTEYRVIAPVAAEYFAEMTGVDQILLKQMHPHDVMAAFDMIATMLRPTAG